MKFSLGKLFGKSEEKVNETKDSVEAIIEDIEHIPLATSEHNVLYTGLNELGGYHFFQTVIVGQLKIKAKQGATINLKGTDSKMTLESDMLEFESDHTDVKGRSITKIDFQIEEGDIAKINRDNVDQIELKINKKQIEFTIVDAELFDEEE
ncbi:MAG: hypothetical protein HRU26_04905 [Psychroserpens sp.]|nr:hypothetical protein [Psychroserpens sp.]